MWKTRLMTRNVLTRYLVICLLAMVTSVIYADMEVQYSAPASSTFTVELGFDPADYNFLIYDPGTNFIPAAMTELGIPYTLRDSSNPVTAQDLIDYDILIVGRNSGGDSSGLSKEVIKNGILGRVILTGHDADLHTAYGSNKDTTDLEPADVFLAQAIEYVLAGGGTGLIALTDNESYYSWLPEIWQIEVKRNVSSIEIVSAITADGYASGVYDDLDETLMSYWLNSYHNGFSSWGTGFVPWEAKYKTSTDTEIDYYVTIATEYSPYEAIELSKTCTIVDNNQTGTDCCDPGDDLIYDICWNNDSDRTFENVTIVDYLPYGVDYDFATDPFNPDLNYDIENHSYTWHIDDLDPNNLSGCVSLTVTVNDQAPAGMFLHNKAYIYSGDILLGIAEVDTPICCWQTVDADIIRVDAGATGYNTGTSWEHAYNDLQAALTRASQAGCSATGYKIYVAEGTYKPGRAILDSFELPDSTEMYGGFKRGGCDFDQRNPEIYKTILTGNMEIQAENLFNEIVVTMGDDCILDGFVVEEAGINGVFGENVDCEVNNCNILRSQQNGLRFINGNIDLNWNKVSHNKLDGIYHSGAFKELAITNCISSFNGENGIYADKSSLILKNSIIAKNSPDTDSFGVRIVDPNEAPVILNSTIAYNHNLGISYVKSDPNAIVENCILYYNNDNAEQMSGVEYTEFSCVQDSVNDPDGLDYIDDDYSNFSGKPVFAYSNDPNYCHLAYNSPLKDRGNPAFTSTEIGDVDIDAEPRIYDGWVDIGADEINTCDGSLSEDDIYNTRDWNEDGIVNVYELATMSRAWLTNSPDTPGYVADPNNYDPNFTDNWSYTCNLNDDYIIDISDLELFLNQWLWTACWKSSLDSRFDTIAASSSTMATPMAMSTISLSLDSTTSIEQIRIDDQEERENIAMLVIGIYQIIDMMEESKYSTSSEIDFDNVDAEIDKLEEILNDMYDDYYSTDKKTKIYKKR